MFRQLESEEFFSLVKGEVESGHAFIPLVGAGLSAQSGIPTGDDLLQYLHSCIARALGIETPKWDPRTDQWPKAEDVRSRDWRSAVRLALTKSQSANDHQIIQDAYQAMADWRSSLRFLSLLDCTSDSARLGSVDPAVIDRFNAQILQGKRASFGHKMIARLREHLSAKLLITTNFDNLIEVAFKDKSDAVKVLEVNDRGALPSPRTVEDGPTLLKLHGSTYALRAGAAIDASPSAEETKIFAEYFGGNTGKHSHVLAVGFSADDIQTMSIVADATQIAGSTIFWIARTEEEVRVLQEFSSTNDRVRFVVLLSERPDLALYELEQAITLSVRDPPDLSKHEPVGPPGIVFVWDAGLVQEEEYAELFSAVGDLVRAHGGLGLEVLERRQYGVATEGVQV